MGLEASTSQPSARPGLLPNSALRSSATWDLNLGGLLQPKSAILLGGLLAGLGFDTSRPGSVLAATGVLALIVAVHEAGHFAAARLQGIRVSKFAIGFGPTIWRYKGPEVEYCLNAIPMGGYVAFPEDDLPPPAPETPAAAADGKQQASTPTKASASKAPASRASAAAGSAAAATAAAASDAAAAAPRFSPDDPDLLKNRPIPQRALVISAGVAANIVFAYLVLLAQISTVGKAETAFLPGVRVGLPEGPAALAASAGARGGLLSGDVLLRIGDLTLPADPSQVSASVSAIRAAGGRELELTVLRGADDDAAAAAAEGRLSSGASSSSSGSGGGDVVAAGRGGGEVLTLRVTPEPDAEGHGRLGVKLSAHTFIRHTHPGSAGEVLAMTQSEFSRLWDTVFGGLRQILTNFAAMSGQLSGPVAIVAAGSDVVRADPAGLFQFAAIVNVNLAAVNILPLPALDGGYLALLLLEALRGGRKLPAGLEAGVMASGFLVLTALGLGLVVRDTLNLL